MAKKKPTRRAAKRRVTEQPEVTAAQPTKLAHRSAPRAPQAPASSIDEGALTRDVIAECRLNLRKFKEAGDLLDRMYSRAALAKRRALYFERHAAPKEVEYETAGPDGSKRRVRRAADYGGDSWASLRDWPEAAEPMKQSMDRLIAALNDVVGGWSHHDLRPTVDGKTAADVLLLHWLLTDESAGSQKPKVCEFQSLPWFTGLTMLGRRTVATMWFASPHKAQWYRRVKEALDWARLQSVPADVVCVSGYGRITFRGHVVDFETSQQRAVIAKLYEANAATMSLGAPIHESLLEAVADGGSGWSIRKLFSGHAAYKTILRPAKGKGMWALYFDDEAEALLKKKEKGQLGGQLRGQVEAKTPTRDRNKPRNSGRAGSASTSQREVDSR